VNAACQTIDHRHEVNERVGAVQLPVTAIIAARNEAANIEKCVRSLSRAWRVLVVDSGSHDETCALARRLGAEVVQFASPGGYPKKRQWALQTANVSTPWTLLIDADEEVPPVLWEEFAAVIGRHDHYAGYLVRKGFHFLGRRFRFGGFSHDAVLLFRTGQARFERLEGLDNAGLDMEVHERLIVEGPIARLKTPLVHHDRKGLAAYIDRHNRYSSWEASARQRFLATGLWGADSITPRLFGNVQERRRFLKQIACRMPGESWLWFMYHYVLRLGFLEGRAGLAACRLRSQYIADVRAKLLELRLAERTGQIPESLPE
jgi:glycosyltransferase involved in cell wall biosynthesis